MNDTNKTQKVPIASDFPTFISTIYLVTKPRPTSVQTMSKFEDAFNMWGKTIAPTPPGEFACFTTPLAYPFEFSKEGIRIITEALKKTPQVDPQSISVKTFPNILVSDQRLYPQIFSKDLIVDEQYISFRLANWNNVEFKRFPTFLVVCFDYSTSLVDSPEQYRKISEYWREKIKEFNNNYQLKEVLEISDNSIKSRDIPILTFVSAGFLYDEKYFNLYFGGTQDEQKRFLTEVSPRPSMATESTLIGLDSLSHEYDRWTRWRFYYSPEPFFYTGHWRRSTYPGGVHGNRAKLGQVLRTTLFVHVVMPNRADQCQLDLAEVERHLLELQQKRVAFLDEFSRSSIADFQKILTEKIEVHRNTTSSNERAEEILSGLDKFKLFVNSAFAVKRADNFDSNEPLPNGTFAANLGLEFFHFQPDAVFHNDKEKANRHERLIQNRLEETQLTLTRLQSEISEASSLLENRRNMIESRKNTVMAIIIPAAGALIFGLVWLLWPLFKR